MFDINFGTDTFNLMRAKSKVFFIQWLATLTIWVIGNRDTYSIGILSLIVFFAKFGTDMCTSIKVIRNIFKLVGKANNCGVQNIFITCPNT